MKLLQQTSNHNGISCQTIFFCSLERMHLATTNFNFHTIFIGTWAKWTAVSTNIGNDSMYY